MVELIARRAGSCRQLPWCGYGGKSPGIRPVETDSEQLYTSAFPAAASFRSRPELITPAEYESFEPGCKSGEKTVSLDKSLKSGGGLVRARNVLKRHERVEKLSTEDRWDESQSVLGLPKTKIVKTTVGKKKKKKKTEEEGDAEASED